MYTYINTYMHKIPAEENEAMNLKKNGDRYTSGFGRRKGEKCI